jgi:hypothetical protein
MIIMPAEIRESKLTISFQRNLGIKEVRKEAERWQKGGRADVRCK